MKVLHLPVNVGSTCSYTVRAERLIGMDVRGLVMGNEKVQEAEGIMSLPLAGRRHPYRWLKNRWRWFKEVSEWIQWADVLHWYFGHCYLPFDMEFYMATFMKKPGVVEWLGSDIRIPELESEDNPWYRKAFVNGYEYQWEKKRRSMRLQKRFGNAGFFSVGAPGMALYVQEEFFPKTFTVPLRVIPRDYIPRFPDPKNKRPTVLHSPTAPVAKGTSHVLKAVDNLKKRFDFDFKLIMGKPHREAMEEMRGCDIYVDQLILGTNGVAALEAMAFGKPTICHIKPSVAGSFGADCPIVNANPETIERSLENLLSNGSEREALGKRGRTFVEMKHNALTWAGELREIYELARRLTPEG